MTNLQVRLLAAPLVMIAGAIMGQAQFKGFDGEVSLLLAAAAFLGGGVLFTCDVIKSIKQNP